LKSGQLSDSLKVAGSLRFSLFTGIEYDLFFEPVRLEGEEALIHA
jgi:hypothetical protein